MGGTYPSFRQVSGAGSTDSIMSEAIAVDTHRFVKRLTDSGITERQAETLADEHVALLDANLATRADPAAVKADLLKRLIGALIAQGGLIVALVESHRVRPEDLRRDNAAALLAGLENPLPAPEPAGQATVRTGSVAAGKLQGPGMLRGALIRSACCPSYAVSRIAVA